MDGARDWGRPAARENGSGKSTLSTILSGVAKALACRPRLLILDEATTRRPDPEHLEVVGLAGLVGSALGAASVVDSLATGHRPDQRRP